ncbi:MAG: hypothetical protein ACXU8O_07575, partial [Asticcacaulis sp.]
MVTFRGALTAETPLTTTTPALKSRPHDPDRPSPLPKMTVTYGDNRATVPYMPGSGIRGRLRRCGIDLLRRISPEGLRLADYYYLAIGGVKGAGVENKADLAAAVARRAANPLVGLFGAATPWAQGRLSVSHAVPLAPVAEQYVTGVRVDDIGSAGAGITLLRPEDQAQWIEMAFHNTERSRREATLRRLKDELAARTRAGTLREGELVQTQAQIDTLTRAVAEHRALAYGSHSVLRPLSGYEFIPPGAVLNQSLTLTHATRHEIGAFIAILREFAFNPVIGGRAAHHNGVVSARWRFTVRDSTSHDLVSQGTAAIVPYETL